MVYLLRRDRKKQRLAKTKNNMVIAILILFSIFMWLKNIDSTSTKSSELLLSPLLRELASSKTALIKPSLQKTKKENSPTSSSEVVVDLQELKGTLASKKGGKNLISRVKPKLVLHVGPQKTATTTIQMGVLGHRKLQAPLETDNYKVINFGWSDFENLDINCLQKLPMGIQVEDRKKIDDNKNKCDISLWNKLLNLYDQANDNNGGMNVIHSNEYFSNVPRNKEVKELFRSLLEKWDVHVIMVYRTLDTWYPSMYAEFRTKGMFKKQKNKVWRRYFYENTRQITFPEWFEMTWKDVDTTFGDPLGTKMFYEDVFGKERVKIIDMFSSDKVDIIYRFVCKHIPGGAPNTCKHLKNMKKKLIDRNKSEDLLINEDLIAVSAIQFFRSEAYLQRKMEKIWKCSMPGRHQATLDIQNKVEEMSLGNSSFILPRVSLTFEQIERLINRTYVSDKMASQPRSIEQIKVDIRNKIDKYSSVNTTAVLEMESWERYFKSTDYLKDCNPEVTNEWLQRNVQSGSI